MPLVELIDPNSAIPTIAFNDPDKLNAMGDVMAEDFRNAISTLHSQKDKIRALILTGNGRAFSAGGDLEMLKKKTKKSTERNRRDMLGFYYSFLSVLSLDVPVIAAINGHAIGASLCLASACDIRICSKEAKLGFAFTVLGLHPGMGASYFLRQVVGEARARELLLTGRIFTAEQALDYGLVSETCEPDATYSRAKEIAQQIAQNAPCATAQLVQSLRTPTTTLEAALEREAAMQSMNYASAEFLEGIQAKTEKRVAKFPDFK